MALLLVLLYTRISDLSITAHGVGSVSEAGLSVVSQAVLIAVTLIVFLERTSRGASRGFADHYGPWVAMGLYLAVVAASSVWAIDEPAAAGAASSLLKNLLVVYLDHRDDRGRASAACRDLGAPGLGRCDVDADGGAEVDTYVREHAPRLRSGADPGDHRRRDKRRACSRPDRRPELLRVDPRGAGAARAAAGARRAAADAPSCGGGDRGGPSGGYLVDVLARGACHGRRLDARRRGDWTGSRQRCCGRPGVPRRDHTVHPDLLLGSDRIDRPWRCVDRGSRGLAGDCDRDVRRSSVARDRR